MTRPLFLLLFSLALFLGGCANEPIDGCVLAAANRREVLRARAFLHPAIEARILGVHVAGLRGGHAALVFRLDQGWWAYDDTFSSRPLHLPARTLPDPVIAARAAFPGRGIAGARWLDPER